jgi:glycine/D-amino acid oxidase-like deaminating enzyme
MADLEFEIVVVGGGVAGMAAALGAARRGAKTLVLEKCPELGGVLRAGLNFPVCGLFDSNANLLNEGLSRELFDAANVPPERMGRVYAWPCPPKKLLALFAERIAAEKNLSVMLESEATAVEERGGRIVRVAVGDWAIRPQVVIDCSGDGAVIQMGSAEKLRPEKEPLAGYSIRFQGLENDPMLPLKVPYALRNSRLPDYLRFSTFSLPDCLKLSIPPNLGRAALQRDIDAVFQWLEEKVPAFGNAGIAETSPHVLRREGVRLKGEHVLTKTEVLSGARFADAVAKCAWPVEYWDAENGQQLEYLPDGAFYEIPLRCLVSPDLGNLLAAGRCISASSEALASARVMGTCIATGEAAGKAAADLCL